MDPIVETIESLEIDKRRLSIFQLTYAMVDWWDLKKAALGDDVIKIMNWITFYKRFLGKFFHKAEKNKDRKSVV